MSEALDDPQPSEPAGFAHEEFAELLREGRRAQYLSYERVREVLAELDLCPEEIEAVLEQLREEGIMLFEEGAIALDSSPRGEQEGLRHQSRR